jgi:hypothetical protein
MEFYAAMKKNDMLAFIGKWMEFEYIILSEVSLAQKTKNCNTRGLDFDHIIKHTREV